jgi:hypothetical protein
MNFSTRRSVHTDLNLYCHHAKPHDMVEVCEWTNGEGWDISLGTRQLMLTHGELQAILVLCNAAHPKETK